MKKDKEKAIRLIIDSSIKNFAEGFEDRYRSEVDNPEGVINRKKNNIFMKELGEEFMFYSAFVRSFDSSFGRVLENIGNNVAKLSFEVRDKVSSFYTTQEAQHVEFMIGQYDKHVIPRIDHYDCFKGMSVVDITSHVDEHSTDHYFYNANKKEHYLLELKSGGDLDNKKAKSEKAELMREYFILKNSLVDKEDKIFVYFATAYNKNGEGNFWQQDRVKQYFAEEELLIGKDYWNFVCNSGNGFKIILDEYSKSSFYIKESLTKIKFLYF